jgi:hypothetical protein
LCNHCSSGNAVSITYSKCFCVCIFRYPACNAHAPCCILFPVRLYRTFQHNPINGKILDKKKLMNIKCVLIFSTTFVRHTCHSIKNWVRYYQICILVIMQSTRYSCQILIKPEFPRYIFKKQVHIRFYKNRSSGSRVVPCGQKEGQTGRNYKANSRFSPFCNLSHKLRFL